MARLSLICPTIGRTTLMAMIESSVPQMKPGDELIIVADGPMPEQAASVMRRAERALAPYVRCITLPKRIGDFGCTPCDVAIQKARGDAVFFIGDDDTTAPGAFDAIRAAVKKNPTVPHLFSMEHRLGRLGHSLACCTVSSQQLVVPRDLTRMPRMAECPPDQISVSDWVFIMKVHEAWGERTMFHDEVIAILVDQNHGRFL